MRAIAALLLILAACAGPESDPRTTAGADDEEPAAICPGRDPMGEPYFGDLHVHTTFSADAYAFGTRNRPDDAYRFASGGTLSLAAPGVPDTRLDRPLDFAAVTDHAEYLGSSSLCRDPASSAYTSKLCREYRISTQGLFGIEEVSRTLGRLLQELNGPGHCGSDGARCLEAELVPWQETREAAARWNAPCRFTTFVAYEHSASPGLSKVHRNVIFRNEVVPALPVGANDEPTALGLWRWLSDACTDAGTGCDAVSIPHNPNLSNGLMFALDYGAATTPDAQAEVARLRARLETVVEMMQMKGESECRNGMWQVAGGPDELCAFEKYRNWPAAPEDCREGTGAGALLGRGCISRLDFARYALIEGLREEERIGVNPYRFGFIGSTDAHDGTAGQVDEWSRDGLSRPPEPRNFGRGNPGGLAGVWAEENTREALFSALQRREVFATSGPRMTVRFFGGWDFESGLCGDPELVKRGYDGGVPMGGVLGPRPRDGSSPVFLVSALRDGGSETRPGTRLQRVQIIKGWVGDDGQFHQAVHDVAGSTEGVGGVDPTTCRSSESSVTAGFESLCAAWQDPDFDADKSAVYYARVLESPTCRYTTLACRNLPEAERPASCDDPQLPATIQERAWTSPVWYEASNR